MNRTLLVTILLCQSAFAADPVGACAEARAILRAVPGFPLDATGPIRMVAGRKELFLDDHVVERLDGLTRRMHAPRKHGPVIRPDVEGDSIQLRTGPFWNPGEKQWMMWYLGGFATSLDGLQWEKRRDRMLPATRYEFKDPLTGREILRQHGDGTSINHAIYDPGDPDPARRYKGAGHKGPLCCLQGGRGAGFYPAISADGLKWQILETAFVRTADESYINVDDERRFYYATVKHSGPYGRSVYLSVSRDFDHWSDPRDCLVFHADQHDQELGAERVRLHLRDPNLRKPAFHRPEEYVTDIYNLPVFRYEGIYVGLPTVFNHSGNSRVNSDGFSMTELASSHDLIHWDRTGNREKFLPLSELDSERNYDTAQLLAANRPIVKDGEVWFYYTGLKWRHHPDDVKSEDHVSRPDTGAILLAKLRLDGFVSLDAGAVAGTLLTKPMAWNGASLHVNLDAPDGELRAEILDAASGKTIPGFEMSDCAPAQGDRLDTELRWRRVDACTLVGRAVQVRFELRRGSLYAFWTK
ncbi:MAG: hypothetical protein FJW38_16495 [Acidobacteria bacterium]|nr:hypothetical protein [Acidobacteriota bacterium]